MKRRTFLAGAMGWLASPLSFAQHPHAHHGDAYERLNTAGLISRPPLADLQAVFDSPAPMAKNPGKWIKRASLPLPRSEMAWATELNGRMHLVGGYGEQRVDRPYHHLYDPITDQWIIGPSLPSGANHIGVTALDGKLYAIGGHLEQNRKPRTLSYVYSAQTQQWTTIAPLPSAAGSIACIALNGKIHGIGGAIGDTTESKKSIGNHYLYDPIMDRWEQRAPLHTARDHVGIVTHQGLIHIIGGRVDSFHTNSNLHHAYDPKTDRWAVRNPLPTARSGHGSVILDGKIFVMGGEGTNKVFGQNEAYDFGKDAWEQYAPMLTPRHGLGAVLVGRSIYVAGGGAIMGGGIQTSIHEAFTLDI